MKWENRMKPAEQNEWIFVICENILYESMNASRKFQFCYPFQLLLLFWFYSFTNPFIFILNVIWSFSNTHANNFCKSSLPLSRSLIFVPLMSPSYTFSAMQINQVNALYTLQSTFSLVIPFFAFFSLCASAFHSFF